MTLRKRWARWWPACLVVICGCGQEPEPADPGPNVGAQEIEPAEPAPETPVSERIIEAEAALNEAQEAEAEPADPAEPERKSPIKIVPTRPMFQDTWEDPYDPAEDAYEEYEDDQEYEAPRRERSGPQITGYHLERLREQQSLYIIQDLMPVDGVLIDRYYKGRVEYEVWEWSSYDEKHGETLVRIRFIDGAAADIMINPGKYVLIR